MAATNENDIFLATLEPETFDGLLGLDTVSYELATAAVTASLTTPSSNTGFARGDVLVSIENLTGSSFNDTLTGGSGANVLIGRQGADRLSGLAGDDTYIVNLTAAGALEDTIVEATNGGTDSVILEGSTGSAASITLAANLENIDGSRTGARALNLTGNTVANFIVGNAAANVIRGGGGADTMDGGDGSDLYVIGTAAEYAAGEAIRDTGTLASAADELRYIATAAGSLILNDLLEGVERVVIGTGTAASAVTTGAAAINVNAAAVGYGLTIIGNNGANTVTVRCWPPCVV